MDLVFVLKEVKTQVSKEEQKLIKFLSYQKVTPYFKYGATTPTCTITKQRSLQRKCTQSGSFFMQSIVGKIDYKSEKHSPPSSLLKSPVY